MRTDHGQKKTWTSGSVTEMRWVGEVRQECSFSTGSMDIVHIECLIGQVKETIVHTLFGMDHYTISRPSKEFHYTTHWTGEY